MSSVDKSSTFGAYDIRKQLKGNNYDSIDLAILFYNICKDEKKMEIGTLMEFIKFGIDPDIEDISMSGPLHYLCRFVRKVEPDVIINMVRYGWDINKQNNKGLTPMHLLFMHNHSITPTIIDIFIECGADLNITDDEGRTIFHHYCIKEEHNYKIIKLLCSMEEIDTDKVDKHGWDGLDYLEEEGGVKSLKRVVGCVLK